MKYLIVLVLVVSPFTDLDKIAKVNKAKKEAKAAFEAGNYKLAHDKYIYLIDSLGVNEDELILNNAHSLYQLKDTTQAVNQYQEVASSAAKPLASVAEQQLGQILFEKKQYEPALEHYKNALRKNPTNQDARYNYELLKKIIEKQKQENKNKNQDQQNKNDKNQKNKQEENKKDENQKDKNQNQQKQEKKEQDNKEQQEKKQKEQKKKQGQEDKDKEQKSEEKDKQQKEGEKSEEKDKQPQKPTPSDKLKEMNISEEKAKMILEAMKNNEIQYIQQNRRKATKKKKSDKPDW